MEFQTPSDIRNNVLTTGKSNRKIKQIGKKGLKSTKKNLMRLLHLVLSTITLLNCEASVTNSLFSNNNGII